MALTELIFDITLTEIGSVVLDASVNEVHRASAKATRHPIEAESGSQADISDHIQVDPLTVQIEGVISNHPALFFPEVEERFAGGSVDSVFDAHQELLDTVLTGRIVTIKTSLLEYPNMVLEAVEVKRDASKGNALYFNATASQITLVNLEETEVEETRPVDQSTKNAGKKKSKAASSANEGASTSALGKMFL